MEKMQPTDTNVEAFLEAVPNEQRRADARELCSLLAEVTGEPPVLWASGIVGFGTYHYRYDSGHEGDAPLAGFAPRSAHLVVYLIGDFADRDERLLARLGPHKTGKSCLYVKRLADIDLEVLRELVTRSTKLLDVATAEQTRDVPGEDQRDVLAAVEHDDSSGNERAASPRRLSRR